MGRELKRWWGLLSGLLPTCSKPGRQGLHGDPFPGLKYYYGAPSAFPHNIIYAIGLRAISTTGMLRAFLIDTIGVDSDVAAAVEECCPPWDTQYQATTKPSQPKEDHSEEPKMGKHKQIEVIWTDGKTSSLQLLEAARRPRAKFGVLKCGKWTVTAVWFNASEQEAAGHVTKLLEVKNEPDFDAQYAGKSKKELQATYDALLGLHGSIFGLLEGRQRRLRDAQQAAQEVAVLEQKYDLCSREMEAVNRAMQPKPQQG